MRFHWSDCKEEEIKRLEALIKEKRDRYLALVNTCQTMLKEKLNLERRNAELERRLKINENVVIKKKRCRREHAIKRRR